MSTSFVDRIVSAVLYEGYILYPYRPSVKNRQRWTFGGLFPQADSAARGANDAWSMQTECLITGSRQSIVDVQVRFLHLLMRSIGEFATPLRQWPAGGEPAYCVVESLHTGGRQYFTWQEAVERTIALDGVIVADLIGQGARREFSFPASSERQPIADSSGSIVGLVVREHQTISGVIEASGEAAGDDLFKIRVRIENLTPPGDAGPRRREEVVLRSFVSTHTILTVRHGEFVSLFDPPEGLRAEASGCRNEGTWPVLVGQPPAADTMLSSPIILYDYPQIAPESPGDLFDATEIDEILTLRILALSDDEKLSMAAVDDRARDLLLRTEALSGTQMSALHGTLRGLRPVPVEEGHV
jgi:hydrogenase maturation protease